MTNSVRENSHLRNPRIAYLIVAVLFFVAATQAEYQGSQAGAGILTLVRGIAAFSLWGALVFFTGGRIKSNEVFIPLAIGLYFILSNAFSLTPFVVPAGLMIVSGALIATRLEQFSDARALMITALRYYIVLNVAALAIQTFLFAVGNYIDLHHMLLPWSESRSGGMAGVARPSGVQIEPGTYANVLYISALIYSLLVGRVLGPTQCIAVVSSLITLSSWAVIPALAFAAAALVEVILGKNGPWARDATSRFVMMFLSSGVLLAAAYFYTTSNQFELAMSRFSGASELGSGYLKLQALNAWGQEVGLGNIVGRPISSTFCYHCVSTQDLGLIFSFVYYLGLLLTLFVLARASFICLTRFKFALTLFAIPLLVTKFYFYDSLVWLVLLLLLLGLQPNQPNGSLIPSRSPQAS